MKTIHTYLATPYLNRQSKEWSWIRRFINKRYYGYNPKNFSEEDSIESDNHKVMLYHDEESGIAITPDLIIAGSTRGAEVAVNSFKGSGLLIARYSIFYKKCSGYSGRKPADGGYSLDIPKEVDSVRCLLKNGEVLDAIYNRDPEQIRKALKKMNKQLKNPVLATSYLEQALSVNLPTLNARRSMEDMLEKTKEKAAEQAFENMCLAVDSFAKRYVKTGRV